MEYAVVNQTGSVLYQYVCDISSNAVRCVSFTTRTVSTLWKLDGAYNVCFDRSRSVAAATNRTDISGWCDNTGSDGGSDAHITKCDEAALFVCGSTLSTGSGYTLNRVNTKTGTYR